MIDATLMGVPLSDEKGRDFLVLRCAHRKVWTPQEISSAFAGLSDFKIQFPVVFADQTDTGEFIFIGEDSLTNIARSRITAQTDWQCIYASK
jgi:hypothetical protein